MSFPENRQSNLSEGLQIPGLVQNQDQVEQLSFNVNPQTPAPAYSQAAPLSSPGLADMDTRRQPISQIGLIDPRTPPPTGAPGTTSALLLESKPAGTQALLDRPSLPNTTASRPPLVIRGGNKEAGRLVRPPQGRRHVIGIAALILLVVIIGGTLFAFSPLGHEVGFTPSTLGSKLVAGNNNPDLNLIAQATAVAVHHQQTDGYDPNAGGGGPIVTGGPHPWPVGVCTYWANSRYHTLTGNWVTWTGNAYQWAQGARAAGWNVSSSPHVPSIMVLMPGVQGASGYGHVAVVESATGNTVHTSNMNWYTNGGGFNRVSYADFTAGPGVYFIWK